MLSFQVMTEKDRREAAALDKRRALDEERKKRLLDPKQRLIGIDVTALEVQLEEKRRLRSEQQQVEKIFDENLKKADQIAIAMEKKENEERMRLQQEINNFRKVYQKPEDRREFDLNDPNYIKKQIPCRMYDEDPRLGISSAQKFEGEDLANDQRRKVQREEICSFLDQQIQEKEAADKERKNAEGAYVAALIARDQRALELDSMEKDCRKKLQVACTRFNKALADEKLCQKQMHDKKTTEDNMAEIYNALTSDMLSENPDAAQSNLGLKRKVASLYRGMTDEEKRKFKEEQLAQIAEAQARKAYEERVNREMDMYMTGIHNSVYLMNRELQIKKKERNKQLAEENKKMAAEHSYHQQYLKNVVYANRATDEFYAQFNKTSR